MKKPVDKNNRLKEGEAKVQDRQTKTLECNADRQETLSVCLKINFYFYFLPVAPKG